MQILALAAMEPPCSLSAESVRDEKVKLLECIAPLTMDELTTGQYDGYLKEPGVPLTSLTPTYAKARLHVNNWRWEGVPFTLSAGKALGESKTEIRVQFKKPPQYLFKKLAPFPPNTMVIRVQPDESIRLEVTSKVPALDLALNNASLDLHYASAFQQKIHDAYERLLLDVLRGEKGLFIRDDELAAAWRIVTPVLHQMEKEKKRPAVYVRGSGGPV